MNMSDALMLVCVALTEGVETPLGHVALFDNDTPPDAMAEQGDLRVRRAARAQGWQNMIVDTIQTMEHSEQFTPGNKREAVYHSLYALADEEQEKKLNLEVASDGEDTTGTTGRGTGDVGQPV